MLAHMNPAPIDFYFDFISPYGWFASRQIEALAARHGRSVNWHSMLLGVSVLKVMGLKPLLDTPLKGDYVRRDVRRHARRLGLEMGRRPDDPVMDPRAAGRAFHWVKRERPALAGALAQAIYQAYWGAGRDLSTAQALADIELPAGIDPTWLRAGIDGPESGPLLRAAVDASLKRGVFGSPTVLVDGEMFWGFDRLADVDAWLQRGGW